MRRSVEALAVLAKSCERMTIIVMRVIGTIYVACLIETPFCEGASSLQYTQIIKMALGYAGVRRCLQYTVIFAIFSFIGSGLMGMINLNGAGVAVVLGIAFGLGAPLRIQKTSNTSGFRYKRGMTNAEARAVLFLEKSNHD